MSAILQDIICPIFWLNTSIFTLQIFRLKVMLDTYNQRFNNLRVKRLRLKGLLCYKIVFKISYVCANCAMFHCYYYFYFFLCHYYLSLLLPLIWSVYSLIIINMHFSRQYSFYVYSIFFFHTYILFLFRNKKKGSPHK